MKHLNEFSNFKWFRKKLKPFDSDPENTLIVHCEHPEGKSLAVEDFIKFLKSEGITTRLVTTAEEDKNYTLELPEKPQLEQIVEKLPIKQGEADITSDVVIWYASAPNDRREFEWGWNKGVYNKIS